MKLTFKQGYLGSSDALVSVDFCCDPMRDEFIMYKDITIDNRAWIYLYGTSLAQRTITHCPFCGNKIERLAIITEGERIWREKEMEAARDLVGDIK